MTVLVSGGSGFIGREIVRYLGRENVRTLGRGAADYIWNPSQGQGPGDLVGISSVIHLAGAGIADKLWSKSRKQELWDSRVIGTRLLVDAAKAANVKTIVSASGIGVYGDRGEEVLTEESASGRGFLAELAEAWEGEVQRATLAGIRVVIFRLGVVMSPQGGLLRSILPIFRWGLGGRLGNGQQYLSWIGLNDVARAFCFALSQPEMKSIYNLVAPMQITNAAFTVALAARLRRPAIVPVPSFAIKLFLGQMGQELMLASQRAVPNRLVQSGFTFECPTIEDVLRRL